MSRGMTFLGLDLGTSYMKGAVLDLETHSLQHVRRVPFPPPLPGLPTLFHEVAPQPIIQAVKLLMGELLTHAPDVAGLVMATQMHGLVLTTPEGEARSNFISWQDQRSLLPHPAGRGSYFDLIRQRLEAGEEHQLGNEVQPSRPLCTLFWMAEQGLLPQGPVIPAGLGDFVLAHLAGGTPVLEVTNAAAHCALNLETGAWHRAVLDRLGLDSLHWPRLVREGDLVQHLPTSAGSLPCFAPVGDHQCALAGTYLEERELSLNISTGSQVSHITHRLTPGDYQTRPYFDGHFINTFTGIPAGRALNLLVGLLTELADGQGHRLVDPWQTIAEAAAAVTETDLEVNLAFFASMVGNRGHITNIHESNFTVGHLFRAAFQQMAANYHECARRLSPTMSWGNLVFSGGLVQKNAVLRELIRERFQLPQRTCASGEDTLQGLLALALVAAGRSPTVQEATRLLRQKEATQGTG